MNLATLMAERGLNQVELSKRSGVSQQLISSYLREGKQAKGPSLQNLMALARGLHCSLEELTGITPDEIAVKRHVIETDNLTPDQRWLLAAWQKLPPDHWLKKALADIAPKDENTPDEHKESDGQKHP